MGQKRNPVYEELYQIYLDGLSLQQVAKTIGITRQCLYKAFKRRNYQLRGKNFQPYQYYDGNKFTLRGHGYYEMTTENRQLMHRYIYEKEAGEIPEGYDIHHLNRNKADNRIENLECLSKSEHARIYSTGNNQFTKNAAH
jgi:hypothetical protein